MRRYIPTVRSLPVPMFVAMFVASSIPAVAEPDYHIVENTIACFEDGEPEDDGCLPEPVLGIMLLEEVVEALDVPRAVVHVPPSETDAAESTVCAGGATATATEGYCKLDYCHVRSPGGAMDAGESNWCSTEVTAPKEVAKKIGRYCSTQQDSDGYCEASWGTIHLYLTASGGNPNAADVGWWAYWVTKTGEPCAALNQGWCHDWGKGLSGVENRQSVSSLISENYLGPAAWRTYDACPPYSCLTFGGGFGGSVDY